MTYNLHDIIEPITVFLTNTFPNCIEIKTIDDSQHVYYHDRFLKNSPIKFPVVFDMSYSSQKIFKDPDLCRWLELVTGYKPRLTWSL
jgi:hypothetical protein